MSWDEKLCGWAWKRVRALTARSSATGHPVVSLSEVKDRLRLLALALGGPRTLVKEAESEGSVFDETKVGRDSRGVCDS